MTDFVKVNFKKGYSCITSKTSISMCDSGGRYFLSYTNGILESIRAYMPGVYNGGIETEEITKEEYGRLCKELGVENAV